MADVRALCFADCNSDTAATSRNTTFTREENKKSSYALSNVVILKVQSCTSEDGCTVGLAAAASISYRSAENDGSDEIFLFGGFELIANVNSLKVFVTRAESDKGEEYLTSCKGIRARDLPDLEHDQMIDVEETCAINWFKFVLASPGGAKPVCKVRLEFQTPASSDQNPTNVITRTMKVKCRLNDSQENGSNHLRAAQSTAVGIGDVKSLTSPLPMTQHVQPVSNESQHQQYTPSTGGGKDITSLMAMMSNMNTMKSTIPSNITNQSVHQQAHQHSEKSHAQIMSSIAGLGMYLKSTEEKTMKSLEQTLAQMESRLSAKLDTLACRLDVVEQHLIKSMPHNGNDNANSSLRSNDADDKKESEEE